jgi:enoyl-CoA hydratase
MLRSTDHDGVRLLEIANGKANTLDIELLNDLRDALSDAENGDVSALVLTGTGTVYSAGVDLFRLLEGGDDYIDRFLPALSDGIFQLFTFPKPAIAAVNGHAIAGGCILACACDTRLGPIGAGLMGIPELQVGVVFPAAALGVMRFSIADRRLPETVFRGSNYDFEQALELGLLDRLVESETLVESALAEARRLAALGSRSFALTKRQLRQDTIDSIVRERQRTDDEVLAQWKDPDTRTAIRSYLERTLSRS